MSLVYSRAKKCPLAVKVAFALLLAQTLPCTGRAEPEVPAKVREALANNAAALSPLTVTFQRSRSSPLPLPDLLKHIDYPADDYAFFEPSRVHYITKGSMFYALITFRQRREKGFSEHDAEFSFDGKTLYTGSGIQKTLASKSVPVVRATPVERALKRNPDTGLWGGEYFYEAGFQVPTTNAMLLQPPKSLALYLMEQGAHVSSVRNDRLGKTECMVIELIKDKHKYRFYLDPAMGYAVRRHEEWSASGVLEVAVDNRNFVRLPKPKVWLPKNCHAEWHTWPSIPDRFTSEPLVFVDITVSEFDQGQVPQEQFELDRQYKEIAGSVIADGRLPGAEQSPGGVIEYVIPAEPADLDEAIRAAIARETGTFFIPHWSSRRRVLILVGGALLAAAVILAAFFVHRRRGRLPAARR